MASRWTRLMCVLRGHDPVVHQFPKPDGVLRHCDRCGIVLERMAR